MSERHKLLRKQLAKATTPSGGVDFDVLLSFISATYDESDADRRRTDRSIALMIDELETLNTRLLDAFDVVPEGLALFDAADRYVLWNRRYGEMYQEIADVLAIGVRFEDVLRAGLARGQYVEAIDREDQWLKERLDRHTAPQNMEEQQLPGDRWLRVEERRTSDGGSIGVRVDITDLKRREASFRLLFKSNPLPMWVFAADTHRFIAVNEAAVAHYRFSRGRFLSMVVQDVVMDDHLDTASAGAERRESLGCLQRHVTADGRVLNVDAYSRSLVYGGQDAVLVAAIDVTERQRAENEVRRAQTFLTTIIENIPVAVSVQEAKGLRGVLVNRASEEFWGVRRDVLIGRPTEQVFPKETAETIAENDRAMLKSRVPMFIDTHPIETPGHGIRLAKVRRCPVFDINGELEYLITVLEDVTEQKRAEDKIAHLAHHDALTDLPNRVSFGAHLSLVADRAAKTGSRFAIICLDLDRFKDVNDVFGHAVGDLLLCEVAQRLQLAAGDAFLARVGGDEFNVIVSDGPLPTTVEAVAEHLSRALSESVELNGHRIWTGLSAGVALFPVDGENPQALLANADAALYRAKADGRGTIRFFEADMDRRVRERRALQQELHSAIDHDQLTIHYQPQATIAGEIVGMEALVRWAHPERGSIEPSVFIPIAEESGLITSLGAWILWTACREAASWPRNLRIAVNLSPVQFQHGNLATLVEHVLADTGLVAERLELEITEAVLIRDHAHAIAILRQLKALGVRIAMDDFGTGYSSLSYLQSFPFDKIKIDKSFIDQIGKSDQAAAIIRAVVGLGRGLHMPIVAEGVETNSQLAFLKEAECDEIQGFIIGRPAPISEYADIIGEDIKNSISEN